MTVSADVQYGPEVAELYDPVIGDAMPLDECLERCAARLSGRRVLDIGTGTGRVAVPLGAVAGEVVGIDNSQAMLDRWRDREVPANVSCRVGDFREPLAFEPASFDGAISTLGSFACVGSEQQLARAFAHVSRVLAPGSPLLLDYYSLATYQPLAGLGTVEVPNAFHPSTSRMTTSIDGSILTVETTVVPLDGAAPTDFTESVLVLPPEDLVEHARDAGLRLVEQELAVAGAPFDWFVLVKEG